jgi:hypothetical protein
MTHSNKNKSAKIRGIYANKTNKLVKTFIILGKKRLRNLVKIRVLLV